MCPWATKTVVCPTSPPGSSQRYSLFKHYKASERYPDLAVLQADLVHGQVLIDQLLGHGVLDVTKSVVVQSTSSLLRHSLPPKSKWSGCS